ncbi:MAG: ABC transporter permease [Phycisphaerae bacterium]
MMLWTIFKVGIKSLMGNAMRSILAMLGIIIGVAAVIAMLALASGFEKKMREGFATMGTNLLVVVPTLRQGGGVKSASQQTLVLEDATAIIKEIEGVEQVAPVVRSSAQLKYASENTRTSVTGSSATYFDIRNFPCDRGKPFTEADVAANARVVVLGPATVENLFGKNDPIGETIKLKGINFKVVGVTKSKGSQGWFNQDDLAIVPYTTAMKQLFGLTYLNEIDIQAKADADNKKVQDDVLALLRKRHRVQEGLPNDTDIRNQADMIQMATDQLQMFRILLASIAAISLLVGGIGIMNIMLVSVTERTREIGVRKAIGAKERSILTQFLIESIIISGLGGLMGVLLGFVASWVIPRATNNQLPSRIEPYSVLLALSFSAFVGIFFGFYPAWRASSLDPVEALRYE